MTNPGSQDRRHRRMLIGMALLFFAPLGLAFFLYYGPAWHPGGRVNAGVLIEPARPLPALALPLQGSGNTDPDWEPIMKIAVLLPIECSSRSL